MIAGGGVSLCGPERHDVAVKLHGAAARLLLVVILTITVTVIVIVIVRVIVT